MFSKQKKNVLHVLKTQRIHHLQTFTARHVKKFFIHQASDINGNMGLLKGIKDTRNDRYVGRYKKLFNFLILFKR